MYNVRSIQKWRPFVLLSAMHQCGYKVNQNQLTYPNNRCKNNLHLNHNTYPEPFAVLEFIIGVECIGEIEELTGVDHGGLLPLHVEGHAAAQGDGQTYVGIDDVGMDWWVSKK